MIEDIKREPIFKKAVVCMGITVILSIFVLNIIHIMQLDCIYKKQLNITNSLVGSLVNKYPNDETEIIEALKNSDKSAIDKGREILDKYGYKEKNIFGDDNFKKYANQSILLFLLTSLIVVVINIRALKAVFKKLIEMGEKVLNYIDNFMENDFLVSIDEEKEGLFTGVFSRINDLGKKLDSEISKLNLEKENLKSLVTDISHQLKTPLSSLKLHNSILMQEDISGQDRKIFLRQNDVTIKKLHNLIDALVNISRLESGIIEINPKSNSIRQTILKAVNACYLKAMDKDISINVDEFDDIKIYHDNKWTEEAIFNILDNAIKYTESKGNIDICISNTVNYFRIDIKDDGIGIDKTEINDLFKRFYRSNNETVKNTEGSGVGLYLSRKILEMQGGNIICSKNIDKGSTFSVLLQKRNNSDIKMKE